jgi:hypothetical protein
VKELKVDLTVAGIPYQDDQGRVADFHALRHTLATNLANAGVPRRVAMEMMRHSDSRLTDKTYTDASQLMTAEAVDALPSFLGTHTVKRTQFSVEGCPAVSSAVAVNDGGDVKETSVNTGESHLVSLPVTAGQPTEMAASLGLEPRHSY